MDDRRAPDVTGLGLWLRETLPPRGVFIDVGANVGEYAHIGATLVGASGHVIAIEPAPENVARLRARLETFAQARVIAAAAGEHSGTTTLFLDQTNGTGHSVAEANVGRRGGSIQVRQLALDELRGGLRRLDVLKIDAQGAELQIVRGARNLLNHFRPKVVLELWPFGLSKVGTSAVALLEEMQALGFAIHRLSAEGRLKNVQHIHSFLAAPKRWNCINIVAC